MMMMMIVLVDVIMMMMIVLVHPLVSLANVLTSAFERVWLLKLVVGNVGLV